ncbi:hypothetical protein [Deinococcus psychrotolerans]|uniref:hypothetical protein n=1 Tax=Deinococcus psychrotolerans TaxID=2489213 RepID=UPI0013DDD1A7|nr:hypothetical protein [Deinococcus psychrotolerans]
MDSPDNTQPITAQSKDWAALLDLFRQAGKIQLDVANRQLDAAQRMQEAARRLTQ